MYCAPFFRNNPLEPPGPPKGGSSHQAYPIPSLPLTDHHDHLRVPIISDESTPVNHLPHMNHSDPLRDFIAINVRTSVYILSFIHLLLE